jgi:hypothetical protein
MAKLTERVQVFIVQRLALFDGPSAIVDAVKEEFGLAVSPEQVRHYDPDRPDAEVAEKWRTLHAEARKAFLEEVNKVPIAHRAVRMRRLQRMADAAEKSRNYVLAQSLLEQAAKEVGDAYTNRRELTGKNGGPIETADRSLEDLSDDELRTLAQKLAAAEGAAAT